MTETLGQDAASTPALELRSRRGLKEAKHIAAYIIAACVAAVLTVLFAMPQVREGTEALPQLADRINPNTATVGSLVRLPGVGITRANAIVAYRDSRQRAGGERVFHNCDDLQEVSGIGPVTAANICPYLIFE